MRREALAEVLYMLGEVVLQHHICGMISGWPSARDFLSKIQLLLRVAEAPVRVENGPDMDLLLQICLRTQIRKIP